jgi:hypothetical protein
MTPIGDPLDATEAPRPAVGDGDPAATGHGRSGPVRLPTPTGTGPRRTPMGMSCPLR